MATIERAAVEFTNNFQVRVRVSFAVKFSSTELQGRVSNSWLGRYGGYLPPGLGPLYAYHAQIMFKVIRIFRRSRVGINLPSVLTFPIDTEFTNFLVTLSDLASPQPDGTVIP
jgi:hypothetical protein